MNRRFFAGAAVVMVALVGGAAALRAQNLNEALEQATKAAVKKASPSVVQIVTQGGIDMVITTPKGPAFRKALGPTTGVIVSPDGYIISSAFNFINNPASILVAVPGHAETYVAQRVATDRSRMLTLLKIDAKNLPVPEHVSRSSIVEGQWSIALGRTLDTKRDAPPSVAVGIVSSLHRIWGKAIQVDAKISPINYGGPVLDIEGRVQGILVPASPKGDDETAGYEWYDSGIGFAIPMEDVLLNALPRLKQGKDLKKGLLGVRMKSADMYSVAPEIAEVTKNSAAAAAGLKPGDVIVEIEGQPIVRMAQVLHALGPKYEGDKINLKYKRGDQVVTVNNLELVGQMTVVAHPFLGILPMRDDPKLGVEIRHVFPKSPADKAGLKAGDRIVKYGVGEPQLPFTGQVEGRTQFLTWLNTQQPGTEIKLEITRKDGKSDKVAATLDPMPGVAAGQDEVPDKLPEVASHKKALEPLETGNKNVKPAKVDPNPNAPKPETGLLKRTSADGESKYWLFVHEEYDPNVAHALVVWLHPPGKNKEADFESFADLWADYCAENNIILLFPASEGEAWIPSEAQFVTGAVRDTMAKYTIDRQRVVAHGLGIGGQMAMYLGFNHRDVFKGVASLGAVVTSTKDNVANQRLSFFLAGGSLDPLIKSIEESAGKLRDRKFPVVYRTLKERGREYFDDAQVRELIRWIDALDRQ